VARGAADGEAVDGFAGDVAGPHPQVTDHDVLGADHAVVVLHADAAAGGGLAGDGEERLLDLEGRGELDVARDTKDHQARPPGFDRGAQAAGPGVAQIGDGDDAPAAAAASQGAGPSAPGKAGSGAADTAGRAVAAARRRASARRERKTMMKGDAG